MEYVQAIMVDMGIDNLLLSWLIQNLIKTLQFQCKTSYMKKKSLKVMLQISKIVLSKNWKKLIKWWFHHLTISSRFQICKFKSSQVHWSKLDWTRLQQLLEEHRPFSRKENKPPKCSYKKIIQLFKDKIQVLEAVEVQNLQHLLPNPHNVIFETNQPQVPNQHQM